MTAGESLRPDSQRRFSQSFRQDYDSWRDFWEEHRVPESPDVPNMRARLGHLVGLAGCTPFFLDIARPLLDNILDAVKCLTMAQRLLNTSVYWLAY